MAWTRFGKKKDMPGGLWIKCESCGTMLFRKEFETRQRVCNSCGYHFTLPARERIALTADPGTFEEMHLKLEAEDRLSQPRHVLGDCEAEGDRYRVLSVRPAHLIGGCFAVGQ